MDDCRLQQAGWGNLLRTGVTNEWSSAFVCDAAFGGRTDEANVFGECSADGFWRRRHEGSTPPGKHLSGKINIDFVAFRINGDAVTILKQRQHSADLGFRSDVADDKSV